MSDAAMISHDATLVVAALVDAGGRCDLHALERQVSPRLERTFAAAWKYLIDNSFARQLHGAGLLLPKDSLLKINEAKQLEAKQLHVAAVVKRATDPRNFHSNYQAVVAGKRARHDPLQAFVAQLNPIDRGEFWTEWLKLSDAEQADQRSRIARFDARRGSY
jgi:hypothetical protein